MRAGLRVRGLIIAGRIPTKTVISTGAEAGEGGRSEVEKPQTFLRAGDGGAEPNVYALRATFARKAK